RGIDPNRMSAAGFAEYQPLDTGNTDEALRRNRRIEMKFTNR
ncbi:MAG TPA: peptidoglycan-binding protein, partial [Rhodospirillaceae bacterium]|nr:peptidoglycan-binding protein [Rhodospirillaceae bacterium]